MAERIVVLRAGRVEQIGAPLDLYDRPANVFVAGFIGSPAMNMIDGTTAVHNRRPAVLTPSGLALPLPASYRIPPGRPVSYGIRPEHLALPEAGAPADVSAQIVVVEPTGSDTHVHMRLDGRPVLAVFRDRVTLRPGDNVLLAIDPGHGHLFDRDTGLRLKT